LRDLLELLGIAAGGEPGDDLRHAEDDQPDADHESQRDDRVERVGKHNDARDDADDTEEDRPAAPGELPITVYENRARREPPTWAEALLFTAMITMRSQPALEVALAAEVPVVHLPGPATACTAVSGDPSAMAEASCVEGTKCVRRSPRWLSR